MHDIPNRIADVLLEVEATLRNHGRWDSTRPPARSLDSTQPFCIDTLRFEQWLQWVFLPRMLQILAEGASNAEFHYLGSAKILGQIGRAFAEALAGMERN